MKVFKKSKVFITTLIIFSVFFVLSCDKDKSSTRPEETTGTVTDIDGNTYQTIKIGNQWWLAENLKVTHYRNGDPISNVSDSTEWEDTNTGALCHYDNNEANSSIYGCLYNWFVVEDPRGIAPEGWHVPSDEEWKELEMSLGMSQVTADSISSRGSDEGGKLKEAGTAHWEHPNIGATNESGFTALPAGVRSIGLLTYVGQGRAVEYWSSTEEGNVWARELSAFLSTINRGPKSKKNGLSIRCVKDN